MSGAITIREATAADLPAMMAIEMGSFTDPWSTQAYEDSMASDSALVHVALDDSARIVGHAVTYFAADEAELATIAVDASVRRQGVGRALLARIMTIARARGTRVIFLEVRASNLAAQAMYEAAGFLAVGTRRRYYSQPVEDAVLMRCALVAHPVPA